MSSNNENNKNNENNENIVIDIPNNTNETNETNETNIIVEKKKHIKFYKQFVTPKVYYTGILTFIVAIACNIIYGIVLNHFSITTNSNEEGLDEAIKTLPVFTTLYICLLAPIFEELIFRRLIFWFINKYNKILAYLVSCFFFAFGHFDYSFSVLFSEFYYFPLYFIVGALFAYAYDRDGCILASMIAHILHNSFAVLLEFIAGLL